MIIAPEEEDDDDEDPSSESLIVESLLGRDCSTGEVHVDVLFGRGEGGAEEMAMSASDNKLPSRLMILSFPS
jgi:hypothetical protein